MGSLTNPSQKYDYCCFTRIAKGNRGRNVVKLKIKETQYEKFYLCLLTQLAHKTLSYN